MVLLMVVESLSKTMMLKSGLLRMEMVLVVALQRSAGSVKVMASAVTERRQ